MDLAGFMLLSLTVMSTSRKVLGPVEVSKWLVGHRTDIGVGVGWTIALMIGVGMSVLPASVAPGGTRHLIAVVFPQQLLFLRSLVERKDLPPRHFNRLILLVLAWAGLLAASSGHWTAAPRAEIALEVATLWVVKLRLCGNSDDKAE